MMSLLKRLSLTFRFLGTASGCVVKYSLGAPYSFREELDRSALQFNYFHGKHMKPDFLFHFLFFLLNNFSFQLEFEKVKYAHFWLFGTSFISYG